MLDLVTVLNVLHKTLGEIFPLGGSKTQNRKKVTPTDCHIFRKVLKLWWKLLRELQRIWEKP